MTALDQIAPETLAGIRERDERALKRAEDPAWSLDQAEFDRAVLVAEVDRLSSERDKARETARHTTNAMVKVGTELMRALREANTSGAEAGMAVVRDLMTDMPSPVEAEPQDGGETP